eukprot:14170-Prymnesium_polylepis.1
MKADYYRYLAEFAKVFVPCPQLRPQLAPRPHWPLASPRPLVLVGFPPPNSSPPNSSVHEISHPLLS